MYSKTSERSEQGYIFAPGELGERRFSREAQEAVGGSGVSFLLVTFLWTSKEKSPRVQGRSHPPLAFQIVRGAHAPNGFPWVSHPQEHAAAGGSTSTLGTEHRG
jgi:hypothetical protein